jgi:hypothetical protein
VQKSCRLPPQSGDAQPTGYEKATSFANDEASNVGGRATVRTDRVDAELANIETRSPRRWRTWR